MSSEEPVSVSSSGNDQLKDRPKSYSSKNLKHILRTPLNHIIGYCEMLMEQAEDEDLDVFIPDLDRIHSAGEQLLAVIDDLCDPVAGRNIDEGKMHHQVRTPLNQVIGYAEMLQEQARELGLVSLIPDLEKVHIAGRDLLELILENFAWTDLKSAPPESGVFTFVGRRALGGKSPKRGEIGATPTQTASLLVVDDNELNRDMLTRRLERLGYKVSCAENGSAALEKLKTGSFDLLLLDIIMPVMDGFEVLEQIKAEPSLREIPVIVLSASDQLDHVVKCIQQGARDYLTKPFNPVLLRARIGSCLERKRLRDQQASYLRQIQQEKERSDELLHVILPREIVTELKDTQIVTPRRFENVGILFCDVVGFTAYSDRHRPEEILSHLQALVEAFEQLCAEHDLEKIKTIGDAFMATAGLLIPLAHPALNCVRCGLDMIARAQELPARWQVRVGVHVGPVVAGVIGNRKYQFDIWGDAVNTASRMQQAASPASLCVNKQTWNLIREHCCGRPLGYLKVKGKGEQELFLVTGFNG
jgi:class 3 adenylate cyclase